MKTNQIEKWDFFELEVKGPDSGNPFTEVNFAAEFTNGNIRKEIKGFYDGDGKYKLRFMPEVCGTWNYITISNIKELNNIKGSFECVKQSKKNHGPVRPADEYHFRYADGKMYYPFGTTSYGWAHQNEEKVNSTLSELEKGYFNKIRMCTLPHYSEYSYENIPRYPFEGKPMKDWDFSRPNPEYFRMIEKRVESLLELNIEADIILFNPYNTEWGFQCMGRKADKLYTEYLISRLSAYRNVWWSVANEYDFVEEKTMDDWDYLCQTVYEADPYDHPISIHNGHILYPHWKKWITHACVQDGLATKHDARAIVMRNVYKKPVIYDEVCYEGNFKLRWGDLSAQEMVHRFWQGIIAGTYVGHGEVIQNEDETRDFVWTGIGDILKGESGSRIKFLREVIDDGPDMGLSPVDKWWHSNIAGKDGKFFIIYFSREKPTRWKVEIPVKGSKLEGGSKIEIEIIDTWNMKITKVENTFTMVQKDESDYVFTDKNNSYIELPGKPYMALKIKRLI